MVVCCLFCAGGSAFLRFQKTYQFFFRTKVEFYRNINTKNTENLSLNNFDLYVRFEFYSVLDTFDRFQ